MDTMTRRPDLVAGQRIRSAMPGVGAVAPAGVAAAASAMRFGAAVAPTLPLRWRRETSDA